MKLFHALAGGDVDSAFFEDNVTGSNILSIKLLVGFKGPVDVGAVHTNFQQAPIRKDVRYRDICAFLASRNAKVKLATELSGSQIELGAEFEPVVSGELLEAVLGHGEENDLLASHSKNSPHRARGEMDARGGAPRVSLVLLDDDTGAFTHRESETDNIRVDDYDACARLPNRLWDLLLRDEVGSLCAALDDVFHRWCHDEKEFSFL
mmetsp:Transcript_39325/g.80603  ORF Transcript_39325/g.80603 Transcript_39325/m.80603 type:complete len:207 (+) Transcript_39325:1244-1864(+)